MMVIAMVESAEGIKNINEILDTPGISAVNIGPSDLSMDMTGRGYRSWWWPDNKNPPEVEAAIQTVAKACKAKKKVCGVAVQTGHGREADQARALQLISDGFRMVSAPRPGQPCTRKSPRVLLTPENFIPNSPGRVRREPGEPRSRGQQRGDHRVCDEPSVPFD